MLKLRPVRWIVVPFALVALTACPGGAPPNGGQDDDLQITQPGEGQVVAGTVALAAASRYDLAGITFAVAGQTLDADADGTATLNTRSLSDGAHTLVATATVGGGTVLEDAVTITVDNDLPASARVGAGGGALASTGGSIAMIAPGALATGTDVSVRDLTQEEILATYGIDYEALGITFLGALDVETDVPTTTRTPLQVDLAGWSAGVQPSHQVLMFSLAPDTDGDGVGELIMSNPALATADGSVITRPIPKTQTYGFESGSTSGLRVQQSTRATPGQSLSVQARGLNPSGTMGNVAAFDDGTSLLASVRLAGTPTSASPLMTATLTVPVLPPGARTVRIHNLSTGYLGEPLTVHVDALGSGTGADWQGLVQQVRSATVGLTVNRPDLAAVAGPLLDALELHDSAAARGMAAASGLVSSANAGTLAAISDQGYGDEQRALVARHGTFLDAVAASVPAIAQPSADLARLVLVTDPTITAGGSSSLRTQQAGGGWCTTTGARSIGATGMGSAPPPGGTNCGTVGGSGGGSGGGSLTTQQAARLGPTKGAIVSIFMSGGTARLSPFTSLTDEAGYYAIPFVPEGEPFTVKAIDPATGRIATAQGVGAPLGGSVVTPLLFDATDLGSAQPATFDIVPTPRGDLEGTWYYGFDASSSFDPDREIVEYVWDFGGLGVTIDWSSSAFRGYGRNGTYPVSLLVRYDDGVIAVASDEVVVDDLPYDYWGPPPERVNTTADGVPSDLEPWDGFAISHDGRHVTFSTEATNLAPDDVNDAMDLYLKDMETGAIELVSSGQPGLVVQGNAAMSADARYVAYAQDTSGSSVNEIIVLDRQEGTTEGVKNPDGFAYDSVVALSGDGRILAYRARTANSPQNGSYVTNLDSDETYRVGLTLDGVTYANSQLVALSSDGRFAVFLSADPDLVPDDVNERSDVFVTDVDTGVTVRASETADGVGGDFYSRAIGRVISDDGRYVVFWTESTTLLPFDANGNQEDVFVKDLVTGELELVSSNAVGSQSTSASVLPVISGDGRYVAFGSYGDNLVPEMDTYDLCLFGCPQGFSYVKDRDTGRLITVTTGMGDTMPDDWDQIEPILSGDGRYVGFYSWATNLAPGHITTGGTSFSRSDYYRAQNSLWEP